MGVSSQVCASELLEVVPLIMRVLRAEVRRGRGANLTIAQLRTLAFLAYNPGCSLSEVAEHVGLTPPSASKLVDGLTGAGLMSRAAGARDRRRVALTLTPRGRKQYEAARDRARRFLAGRFDRLGAAERGQVLQALETLHVVFRNAEAPPAAPAEK